MTELPEGPFATIVADPPWPYDTAKTGRFAIPKPAEDIGQVMVSEWTYSHLDLDDIAALPVRDRLARDAHLYLWVTNSFMAQGHDIAKAWGFTPKTILTWVKVRRDDPAVPSMKTGWWFRGATEHVIFATRGHPRRRSTEARPTAMLWPRESEHSRKPDRFYDLVEEVSEGPYLELFARRGREGWASWGDQLAATP